jgi:hypothetical protein
VAVEDDTIRVAASSQDHTVSNEVQVRTGWIGACEHHDNGGMTGVCKRWHCGTNSRLWLRRDGYNITYIISVGQSLLPHAYYSNVPTPAKATRRMRTAQIIGH